MSKNSVDGDPSIVRGDFFTDGKTFVFRLADTPLSGVGDTPSAAFQDLMRVDAEAASLSARLRDLSRDQQGERVRAEIIRMSMIALIVFGVAGGAVAASAALMPRVLADITCPQAAPQ